MVALGVLSPIDDVRAKLQEKIADFLAARSRLSNLMKNPSLQIQGEAKGLLSVQIQLEDRLYKEILPKIQAIQAGVWSFSDIALIGSFTSIIVKQIGDVNRLVSKSGGIVEKEPLLDVKTMMIGIPALLVLGLLSGYMFARS